MLWSVFVLLFSLCSAAVGDSKLVFNAPSVIINEEPAHVRLAFSEPLGPGSDVVALRTVLHTPGKRGPKFFANISLPEFTVLDSVIFEVAPVYNLPTQAYKIGFSALVRYEGEDGAVEEWIDSEESMDVRVEDPNLDNVKFVASIAFIVVTIVAIVYMALQISPGYWEKQLPAWMQKYLPDQKQKRRN